MKLSRILAANAVKVPMAARTRQEAIDELVDLLAAGELITKPDVLKSAVWEREQQRSTGIGEGLAIPHGKSNCSQDLVMAVGRPEQPIDFNAVDRMPVRLIVLLASPPDRTAEHIQALGKISRLFLQPGFRENAFGCSSPVELHRMFTDSME